MHQVSYFTPTLWEPTRELKERGGRKLLVSICLGIKGSSLLQGRVLPNVSWGAACTREAVLNGVLLDVVVVFNAVKCLSMFPFWLVFSVGAG